MIKNKLKLTLLIFSLLFSHSLFLLSTPPVIAEELINREQITSDIKTAASTTNTGDNVSAENNSNTNNETAVNNDNNSTVNQTVEASANTGNNEASRNISFGGSAGVIQTGDASTNAVGVVNTNGNSTQTTGDSLGNNDQSALNNTGDKSNFSKNSQSSTLTTVQNGNKTTINQTAVSSANTGNNKADRNISFGGASGVITTGNASTTTTFLVAGNGNVVLVGGDNKGNGPGSGASIYLTNTGGRLKFLSLTNHNEQITVNNQNQAHVTQICGYVAGNLVMPDSACSADTGHNQSNRGIAYGGDAGVINTGNATVQVSMIANANTNQTAVNSESCPLNGVNSHTVNTGNDVSATQATNKTTQTTVNNQNNAMVDQKVRAKANTGHNQANRNISFGGSAGIIKTGNAAVNTLLIANVNQNKTEVQNTPCASNSSSDPSDPTDPTDPADPTDPNDPVITPSPILTNQKGGGNSSPSILASSHNSASSTTPTPTPNKKGSVLGISVNRLPTTGPSENLILLGFLSLLLGLYFNRDSLLTVNKFHKERR